MSVEKVVVSFLDGCEKVTKEARGISLPYFRRRKPCSRQLLVKWREKMTTALRELVVVRLTYRWENDEGLFVVDRLTLGVIEAVCESGQ